ncbi:MAG: DUF4143 domain-containing protein [Acholeplasmataceae bacterium]|nr:DUF4143 domain-containing protein [Acholeplasmataceae bacterium]
MYYYRLADEELKFRLSAFGATLIVGPKWCGKTTTASRQAKSILDLQDPDRRLNYLETANTKPSLLLLGDKPRLIDEWQDAPVLWDAVRKDIDKESQDGLYILTGSTSKKVNTSHTGTGRITTLKMYPMSLYESKESNGSISLKELFYDANYDIDGKTSNLSIEELIFAACRGGWPASLFKKSDKAKLAVAQDYFEQIYEKDISALDNISRNPKWARAILRSYARNICTLTKTTTILEDLKSDAEVMSMDSLTAYIDALQRLYVINDVDAWCPAIRSATVIRSGKKRCLVDPSIVVAALGLSPEYFYTDLKTFGFIFECLCIRDLKVYSENMGGEISYYHDRYGLEVDGVLHLKDGKYALIEFKLGSKEIELGAKHLLEVKRLIKEHNINEKQCPIREPDLLIIITGGEMAYTRNDGVKIIPIGCLKN